LRVDPLQPSRGIDLSDLDNLSRRDSNVGFKPWITCTVEYPTAKDHKIKVGRRRRITLTGHWDQSQYQDADKNNRYRVNLTGLPQIRESPLPNIFGVHSMSDML